MKYKQQDATEERIKIQTPEQNQIQLSIKDSIERQDAPEDCIKIQTLKQNQIELSIKGSINAF